jgi:hypothetical protein
MPKTGFSFIGSHPNYDLLAVFAGSGLEKQTKAIPVAISLLMNKAKTPSPLL